MRGPDIITGAEQYEEFTPKYKVEGETNVKPELNQRLEQFINETAITAAGANETLKRRLMEILDSHDPLRGQNFGALGNQALDAGGHELTMREQLASAAIAKMPDELDRLDALEDAVKVWVEMIRKQTTS